MVDSITAGIKRGNTLHAAGQLYAAVELVDSESPIRGRQKLNLAAAQLAILVTSGPESLANRLVAFGDDMSQAHNYDPNDMTAQVLNPDELAALPMSKAIIGLIAQHTEEAMLKSQNA